MNGRIDTSGCLREAGKYAGFGLVTGVLDGDSHGDRVGDTILDGDRYGDNDGDTTLSPSLSPIKPANSWKDSVGASDGSGQKEISAKTTVAIAKTPKRNGEWVVIS